MKLSNKIVYLFSPEPWGINFLSKHHYARELACRGNDVYFFNPPSTGLRFDISGIREINENLKVVDYKILRGINSAPRSVSHEIHRRNAKMILRNLSNQPDLVWSFDPFLFRDLSIFSAARTIYFKADISHSTIEREVVETSDLCLTVAESLKKGLDKFINIGHGVSEKFFKQPLDQVENRNTTIGYVGNLSSPKIDYHALYEVVRRNQHIDFCFIGPSGNSNIGQEKNKRIREIFNLPNTDYLGELSTEELISSLHRMDAFLIVYDTINFKAEVSNSHKILEFMSTGKVSISNHFPEYDSKPSLIEMVRDNRDLPLRVTEVTNRLSHFNQPKYMNNRRAFAQSNSYGSKIELIEKLLGDNPDTEKC